MSFKAVSWAVIAAIAITLVLILNYWASYQPLSTLAYSGILLTLCGLANLATPFRFLGIHKRSVGAFLLAGGLGLALAALLWPASMIRVAQHKTCLDDVMPEYQFSERHSQRIHARPEQVTQAIRQATMADLKSYVTLMRIRAAAFRRTYDPGNIQNERVLDVLSTGFISLGDTGQEIVMGGVGNARSTPRPQVKNLQDFAAYQQGVKLAFNLNVEDAGNGWSTLTTETRVLALDDLNRRAMTRYWRLIVPGSGLIRRQWLEAIKRRAESAPATPSS